MALRVLRVGSVLVGLAAVWAWLPAGLSWRGAVIGSRPDGTVSSEVVRDAAVAVARTWMADHPPETVAWSWGEGVLMFGLQQLANDHGQASAASYVGAYLDHHARRGIEVRWSDDATPALSAAARTDARHHTSGPQRALVKRVVAYVMRAPRTRPRGLLRHLGKARLPLVKDLFPEVWVDTVFHTVPTLLRDGRDTGDADVTAEALHQLEGIFDALQDPRTGLLTHAFDDGEPGRPVPPFDAQRFWARGNGWMLASLVDALEVLPRNHPRWPGLCTRARKLASAVARVQDRTGLFHTLLLDPTSYLETAGSALLLYGLARGDRLGVFEDMPAGLLASVLRRGRQGLLGTLRWDGERAVVTGTSLGTNPVAWLYRLTPTADQVNYGVGAFLLAASEMSLDKSLKGD